MTNTNNTTVTLADPGIYILPLLLHVLPLPCCAYSREYKLKEKLTTCRGARNRVRVCGDLAGYVR